MKQNINDLAFFGGEPLFPTVLLSGQQNMPDWNDFKQITSGIFERRYYSNHGVLAQELESKLEDFFNVNNAILLTNKTIGLSLCCIALGLKDGDKIIVPSFSPIDTIQALTWAKLTPVFCDISEKTFCISLKELNKILTKEKGIKAILAVNLWGNCPDLFELSNFAKEQSLALLFDSSHSLGCTFNQVPIGKFGDCEAFSLHSNYILTSTEGACITTNNDDVAESLRNLRSNYGRRKEVAIPIKANGRFSELQAAFGLLSLRDIEKNRHSNKIKTTIYINLLRNVPGVALKVPSPTENHNYQWVIVEIIEEEFGLNVDQLMQILRSENILQERHYIYPGFRLPPYAKLFPQPDNLFPVADMLYAKTIQLPIGSTISEGAIKEICNLLVYIQQHNKQISSKLDQQN